MKKAFVLTPALSWLLGSYVLTSLVTFWFVQSVAEAFHPSPVVFAALGCALAVLFALGTTQALRKDLWNLETSLARFLAGRPLPPLDAPTRVLRPSLDLVASLAVEGASLEALQEDWRRRIGETAAQEERNRLARDLHDSVKQQLFSIHLGAATARERWDSDHAGAREAIARVRTSAHRASVEMQALLQQLQPEALAAVGLVGALREQCEALSYRTEAEVQFSAEPAPYESLAPKIREEVFRIAQEVLANVARHARARHVQVDLRYRDDELTLRIRDDGQGFAPKTEGRGMGLRNLRHRAESLGARLEIASQPGAGCSISLEVPCPT
jgi:signal transduction histidine kinase